MHGNDSVAGCDHEFCTRCALYLCSTSSSSIGHGPPGSIACPLCRHGIVSFAKLPGTRPMVNKEIARASLSLTLCTCSGEASETASLTTPLCKPTFQCTRISPLGSSFRSLSCQKFPSMKINASLCMGTPDTSPSLVPCSVKRNLRTQLVRCSRSGLRRSVSHSESRGSWFSALNQYVATGSGCWKVHYSCSLSMYILECITFPFHSFVIISLFLYRISRNLSIFGLILF